MGSTLPAGVIVAIPLILHFYYLVPDPTQHRQTSLTTSPPGCILLSWYLAMIVDIIPVFCEMVIDLAWGEVTETIWSRIKLYNAVKDDIKPVLHNESTGPSCLMEYITCIINMMKR